MKKILSGFLMPLTLSFSFMVCGLVLLVFSARQRIGKILTATGIILLFLFSFPPLSRTFIQSLETRYRSVTDDVIETSKIRWIVVLGGGHNSKLPKYSQLSYSSLARVVEAVRIYHQKKGIKIILSGGSVFDPTPNARAMSQVAVALGVPPQDIVLESASRDTEEEVEYLLPVLKTESFFLVTSAAHMARSVALFEKQEMNPVAAPTDYSFHSNNPPFVFRYLPSATALEESDSAIHEYLGLVWSRLRGKL